MQTIPGVNAKAKPSKTITIMADFGNGPYAWLKDASDESRYVGINIADAVSGFCDELFVSLLLENDFAEWIISFECNCDAPTFDWQYFHSRGLSLSYRLAQELSGLYRIFYVKPCEDPNYETDRHIEICNE